MTYFCLRWKIVPFYLIPYEILLVFAWLYVSIIKALDFICWIVEVVSDDRWLCDAHHHIIVLSPQNLELQFKTKDSKWVPTAGIARGLFENLFEVELIHPFSCPYRYNSLWRETWFVSFTKNSLATLLSCINMLSYFLPLVWFLYSAEWYWSKIIRLSGQGKRVLI